MFLRLLRDAVRSVLQAIVFGLLFTLVHTVLDSTILPFVTSVWPSLSNDWIFPMPNLTLDTFPVLLGLALVVGLSLWTGSWRTLALTLAVAITRVWVLLPDCGLRSMFLQAEANMFENAHTVPVAGPVCIQTVLVLVIWIAMQIVMAHCRDETLASVVTAFLGAILLVNGLSATIHCQDAACPFSSLEGGNQTMLNFTTLLNWSSFWVWPLTAAGMFVQIKGVTWSSHEEGTTEKQDSDKVVDAKQD